MVMTITVPDDTYARLQAISRARGRPVEALVCEALERMLGVAARTDPEGARAEFGAALEEMWRNTPAEADEAALEADIRDAIREVRQERRARGR